MIGVLALAAGLGTTRQVAALQRRVLTRFAGIKIDALPRPEPGRGRLARLTQRLTDRTAWRAVAYLVVRLPLTAVQAYVLVLVASAVADLLYPVGWLVLQANPHGQPVPVITLFPFGGLTIRTWPGTFLASLIGAALLAITPLLAQPTVAVDGWLARALLGPGSIDRRVRELERTRTLAVDGAAAALRHIERDLHDGAQVRLTSLALHLGLAREKTAVGTPDLPAVRELLAAAQADATGALADLRDLVRGIHPPVLDNGLAQALASLAAAAAIPVRVTTDLPRRPSAAIEAIAYFCAAELVTNAVKHSFANEIALEILPGRPEAIVLTVTDDGVGGADPARGSGLSGLARRVPTVDGRLAVSSPPGGPTIVTAELPTQA